MYFFLGGPPGSKNNFAHPPLSFVPENFQKFLPHFSLNFDYYFNLKTASESSIFMFETPKFAVILLKRAFSA